MRFSPDPNKNEVVILGSCPTGLGTVRSLGKHNIQIWTVDPSSVAPANYSRYSKVLAIIDPNKEPERLLETLKKFAGQRKLKPLIFPSRDDYVAFIGEYYNELTEHFITYKLDKKTIETYLNKKNYYKLCMENDVPIPRTFFIEDEVDIKEISEQVIYPSIIKPIYRHVWDIVFKGMKSIKVHNSSELVHNYDMLKNYDLQNNVMIQQLITGPDLNIFVFMGYYDKDHNPLVVHTARRLRQYPPKCGTGTMFHPELNQEMLDIVVPFLQKLKYHGLVGAEMKFDPIDNGMKMFEVNPRMSRWSGIVETSGINLPYVAYNELLGRPMPEKEFEIGERTLIHGFRDTLSSIYYIRTKEITFKDWLKTWKGPKYYCVYAPYDKMPFFAGIFTIFYYMKNYIKKKLRKK